MKNLKMIRSPLISAICARLAFEAAASVVADHAELVGAADVKTAQEVAALVAPTKSPGLEGGVMAETCKIVCYHEAWAVVWGWAEAWARAWAMELSLKCPPLI